MEREPRAVRSRSERSARALREKSAARLSSNARGPARPPGVSPRSVSSLTRDIASSRDASRYGDMRSNRGQRSIRLPAVARIRSAVSASSPRRWASASARSFAARTSARRLRRTASIASSASFAGNSRVRWRTDDFIANILRVRHGECQYRCMRSHTPGMLVTLGRHRGLGDIRLSLAASAGPTEPGRIPFSCGLDLAGESASACGAHLRHAMAGRLVCALVSRLRHRCAAFPATHGAKADG
jgi:hypothetical protein